MGKQLDLSSIFLDVGEGQKNLMKLAERTIKSYNTIFSSCTENQWMPLSIHGGEDIFVKTNMNLDAPGTPRGVAVTISTSVWLPIPQNDIFKFLRAGENRFKVLLYRVFSTYSHANKLIILCSQLILPHIFLQWDLLSYGCMTRDALHIPSARDPANSVSLVIVEVTPN